MSNLPIKSTAVSFEELLRARTHATRTEGNHIYVYNIASGNIEYILKKNPNTAVRSHLVEKEIDGSIVYVEEDIPAVTLSTRTMTVFSELLLEQICELIVEGESLKTICSKPGYPRYSVLCGWKRKIPGVAERLEQARADRGEYLRDMAMEEIEAVDEDNVHAQTAKHKALVWAAGVDDQRYSPKAKIEANITTPTQILVYTGIGDAQKPAGGADDKG